MRGNLALKNSVNEQTPVRVIHRFLKGKDHDTVDARTNIAMPYTYDGLYLVEDCREQKGDNGKNVFMFQMRRIPGQPGLSVKEVKNFRKAKMREGMRVKDISYKGESIPIEAASTIDIENPPEFGNLGKMKDFVFCNPTPSQGCLCTGGCFGSTECSCSMNNGGIIPHNCDGTLVEPRRPLVYECGKKCECPPCHNRVSQHGIKFPLELFKTEFTGWVVRSLKFIPSGSFVCEYTGIWIQKERTGNDEYLLDVGHNYAVDAARVGNIARFIKHSCSPNLYAQNLLYDHHDESMPHVMLFAAEDIPPLKELTYHYNMALDQVGDQDGNIKKM